MLYGESAKSQVLDCRKLNHWEKAIAMARALFRLPRAERFDNDEA